MQKLPKTRCVEKKLEAGWGTGPALDLQSEHAMPFGFGARCLPPAEQGKANSATTKTQIHVMHLGCNDEPENLILPPRTLKRHHRACGFFLPLTRRALAGVEGVRIASQGPVAG